MIDTIHLVYDKENYSYSNTQITNIAKHSSKILGSGVHVNMYSMSYNTNNVPINILITENGDMLVKFSAAKLLNSNNLFPVNEKDFENVINLLAAHLSEFGIHANLELGKIVRLDTFINVKSKYGYEICKSVLKALRCDAIEKNTIYFRKNRQRTIMMYDKTAEMTSRHELNNSPDNYLRFELQLKKAASVKRYYAGKITKIGDIISNYGALYETYKRVLEKEVFNINETTRGDYEIDNVDSIIIECANNGGRRWKDKVLNCLALMYITKHVGIDVFASALKKYDRESNITYFIRQLRRRGMIFELENKVMSEVKINWREVVNYLHNEIIRQISSGKLEPEVS